MSAATPGDDVYDPTVVRRVKRLLAATYPLDFNRSFDSLLFVAGTGRSGTTWLGDLLNADNRCRVIFEPFMPGSSALGGHDVPRYIRPTDRDPETIGVVERILLGKFRSSRWTSRGNRRLVSRQRMIKDVQSNLRLGWLREAFPPFPIVLIVRHPCAVAASRGRLGDARSIEALLDEPMLVEDHLLPYLEEINRLESPFERAVARWCIETFVPLSQLGRGLDLEVVLYEQLVDDPTAVLSPVFGRLGLPIPDRFDERVRTPSHTSYRGGSPLADPTEAKNEWRTLLTDQEVERALELVTMFGLDWLYGAEVEPRVRKVDAETAKAR
jgi:hypothetical protein